MTIIDKRRGGGAASDMAQQATQRAIDTNVPDHVKTGLKLSGVSIGPAGTATVGHKLNRKVVGWHTMRTVGTGEGLSIAETKSDEHTITFARSATSTGTIIYDIWVF